MQLEPLAWDAAVAAGVVSDDEADLFRECVLTDGWAIAVNYCGLDDDQAARLASAIAWFTSVGPKQ